jgi:hypothetical protein
MTAKPKSRLDGEHYSAGEGTPISDSPIAHASQASISPDDARVVRLRDCGGDSRESDTTG